MMKIKKWIIFTIICILGLIFCIVLLSCNSKNQNEEDKSILLNKNYSEILGLWEYEDGTLYEFKSNLTGGMYVGDYQYTFSYTCDDKQLVIDYVNDEVHDAEYQYSFADGNLKLVGGNGTAGGEYLLLKHDAELN